MLILVIIGKMLDMTSSFPAAFVAGGALEALALAREQAFTRETGRTYAPLW